MSAAVDGATEPDGLDWRRVVQVITARGVGAGGRGSGYQVTGNLVLTAAHVLCDATSVQVRFLTECGGTREVHGTPDWADSASDIALIRIADSPSAGGQPTDEVSPVRFARIAKTVDCEALGFPRFRLRPDATSSDRGEPVWYRDSHHVRGDTSPLGYMRAGRLAITVKSSPEYDPERGRSPWEGMSGAPVWSGGCVIGVISEHHRPDGLGTLDLFLVPIGPDEEGMRYEAVFR